MLTDQSLIERVVKNVIDEQNSKDYSEATSQNVIIGKLKAAFEKEQVNLILAQSPRSHFALFLSEALTKHSITYTTISLEPLSSPALTYDECPGDYREVTSCHYIPLNSAIILSGIFQKTTEELKQLTAQKVVEAIKTLPEDCRFEYYKLYTQIKSHSAGKKILPQLIENFCVSDLPSLVGQLGIREARLLSNLLPPSTKSQAFHEALSRAEQILVQTEARRLQIAAQPVTEALAIDDQEHDETVQELTKKRDSFAIKIAKELKKWSHKKEQKPVLKHEWAEPDEPMETTPLFSKK